MLPDINNTSLITFIIHFVADAISLFIVAYLMYFRRHSRRDLLMAYACFNIGLFLVMSVMSFVQPGFDIGFKLFAILSIIRIRSEELTNTELSYAFMILIIGLINAMGMHAVKMSAAISDDILLLILNVIAVAVIFVMDHPKTLRNVGRQQIILDKIHANDTNLRADLERRMRVHVLDYAIAHVDYVSEVTVIDVRYAALA